MLDPASYGTLTINKSISIINDGGGRGDRRPGTTGITITAAATDTIHLRGLIIHGAGTAFRGSYLSALRARVKDDVNLQPSPDRAARTSDGVAPKRRRNVRLK